MIKIVEGKSMAYIIQCVLERSLLKKLRGANGSL